MSMISANTLIQNALVEFLSSHHYEKHLRLLRRAREKNKRQFYHYLKNNLSQHCQIYNYPSGYFLWIELAEKTSSMDIYQELLQQQISIAPSPLFNILPSHKNFIRLNYSFEWNQDVQQALDTFISSIDKAESAIHLGLTMS